MVCVLCDSIRELCWVGGREVGGGGIYNLNFIYFILKLSWFVMKLL